MTVTTVATPVLATIPNVEILHVGQFNISTGMETFTTGDLLAAVGALDCPAIRRPVLKLGHTDPRFDGEPAVGWVANVAVADDGLTLVGDFTGMPSWLADIAASAYPDRSVEGYRDFTCQIGHLHPFVIEAVAFLGVTAPGVGTLESLQDVAALYGVVAAHAPQAGQFFAKVEGNAMTAVAAAVSVEDVRRQFYEGATMDQWICEVQLDPLQLIVANDADGTYQRIAVKVTGDTAEFADPVTVTQTYVDAPAPTKKAASRVVYASRDLSRADSPPQVSAAPASDQQEGAGMNLATLRETLAGLPDDASDIEVSAAIAAAGITHDPPVEEADETEDTAPALPEGTVLVDAALLADLQQGVAAGRAVAARVATEDRERAIEDAVRAGKIPPARRTHYAAAWDADPEGTKGVLASLSPGLVPVTPLGYAGDTEAENGEFDRMFSTNPQSQEA